MDFKRTDYGFIGTGYAFNNKIVAESIKCPTTLPRIN